LIVFLRSTSVIHHPFKLSKTATRLRTTHRKLSSETASPIASRELHDSEVKCPFPSLYAADGRRTWRLFY
jgi:hypothetical protein